MSTQLRFTGAVDRRFAWLGNDAVGGIDLAAELVAFIGSASTSIAVSSMTFSLESVGDALAAAASAGRTVRIVANAGHRFQPGWFRAQRGPVQLADNNLAALVTRISFQQAATPAFPGFLVDSGLPFGPRGGGMSYGWSVDVSADIGPHSAPPAFATPVLGQCYAKRNDVQRTWSIALPPGCYYVVAVTGEANYNSKSFVLAQGQTIFTFKDASGLHYSDHTDCGVGEFKCSIADGGVDAGSGEPQGRRLDVTSGTLSFTVGQGTATATTFTSLDYVEIYRASPSHPYGDPGIDRTLVQERQLHHTKFLLVDAGTPAARVWTGSHNLTPIDPATPRSEDAVVTDEAAICIAFATEFDQWWGGSAATPAPSAARHGTFKTPIVADGTMASAAVPGTYGWKARFSPSTATPPGVDIYQVVADHLGGATNDVLMLLEQLSDSGDLGAFHGTTYLMTHVLDPKAASGVLVLGSFGNTDPTDSVFTRYGTPPNAAVQSTSTHDKMVLVDALHDTRQRRTGKLLCGSMNFSQSALHSNDEQTLVLADPALTNQALQRVMAGLSEAGVLPVEPADIVVVIDRSFSMNDPAVGAPTKIAAARDAAAAFIDMVTADGSHRVALVRFGVSVEPYAPPEALVAYTTGRRAELHGKLAATVATLPVGNATCYGRPLQEAQLLLSAVTPKPRRLVVFLTDGKENTAPFANGNYQPLGQAGVEIHTTAFGPFDPFATGGPNAVLNDMATSSGGSFAQVDDDAVHLQKRFAEVARDAMGMVTVVDPSFELAGGAEAKLEVPLDIARGAVQFCAFWGGGPARSFALAIRTPWGEVLSAKQPGVTRLGGDGREIWRVDLAAVSVTKKRSKQVARKQGPIGVWTVVVVAHKELRERARVDLAVYAARGGADLHVELAGDRDKLEILARVLDGQEPVLEPRLEVVAHPPVFAKESKPVVVRMTPVARKDRGWQGVQAGAIALGEPGVHTIRAVTMGKTRAGAFRREVVLHHFVARHER